MSLTLSTCHCKGLSLVLTCSWIVFILAPGQSYSPSWWHYFDVKTKVHVIIIFFNSFRKPFNLPCSSGHPAKRLELRRTQLSRLQKLCCSELGWVINLGNVCSVASQRIKIVWVNWNDLFSFQMTFFFYRDFKITSFLEINLCYFQSERGPFISSNLKQ